MVALSAVAEWILSIGWVAYMSTIAYDLYHISIVIEIYLLANDSKIGGSTSDTDSEFAEQSMQLLLPQTSCRSCTQIGEHT